MSRTSFLILIGILAILTPFSGFPTAFRSLFTVVLGIAVLGIGLSLRMREMPKEKTSTLAEQPEAVPEESSAENESTEDVSPHTSNIG